MIDDINNYINLTLYNDKHSSIFGIYLLSQHIDVVEVLFALVFISDDSRC